MITIISGTNRPHSYTAMLADYYHSSFKKLGAEVNLINLENLADSIFSSSSFSKRPKEFLEIQELINNTAKFVFIIPEYNGSFPGALKMLIDLCAYPSSFYDKKACLVGLSAGKYGNIRGIEHFSGVCAYLHLHVLPLRLHIPLIKTEIDANNKLTNPETIGFVQDQILKFIKF